MSVLLKDRWVQAMRNGDHDVAWAISEMAFAENERRCNDPTLPYHLRQVWQGEPPDERHVLVRCYHGLGDTIQFLRYLPALRRRARSVTLEIQPQLAQLLAADPPADRLAPFDPARPLPASECDIEIMELSFVLREPPSSCPPPYIAASPALLPPETIGICCMAGEWDNERSIPPELLAPVCEARNCITLDLQPSALPVLNPSGCPCNMMETAALVSGLSLVITVDTMIGHLAGAMGKPTWMLLKHEPDWRWSHEAGRSDWYPSVRLYSQTEPGEWLPVVERISGDLDDQLPRLGKSVG
jgi:hypothetical protein